MATLAAVSHDSSIDVHHIDTSFTFDSDHGLDLSLDDFPIQHNRHLSLMSDFEETQVVPQGQEVQVPTHPILSMQAAFAESMLDAFDGSVPAPAASGGDSVARRKLLLEQDISEETHAARWKQKPGQRYHELWKLMSQISFGIYLLLGGLARDDDQALTILQGHVDEVDLFLEMTLEDFDLAQEDIDDRLKNLKLPLQNIHIFEGMLEDRDFRNQIVSGNETIEHIITRTASAMNDALKNVQQGMAATKEFATYMAEEQSSQIWQTERPEMKQVFDAMKGNADGWYKAYISLHTRGKNLGTALVQLGTIVAEIDRRAAGISRKTRFSVTTSRKGSLTSPVASPPQPTHLSFRQSRSSMRPGPRSRPSMISIRKELPEGPAMITPAIRATLPVFQLVAESEEPPERDYGSDSDSNPDTGFEEPQLLTLSARTYTPPPLTPRTYSPAPQVSIRSHTPEPELETPKLTRRSSLRDRLSTRKPEPPPLLSSKSYTSTTSRSSNSNSPTPSNSQPQQRPPSHTAFPRPPIHTTTSHDRKSPPNQNLGPDSAYYSDTSRVVSVVGTPSEEYHHFIASSQPPTRHEPTPRHDFGSTYIATPRSDQQHFQPVQASPHSPLQRPWTAAPSERGPPGVFNGYSSYNNGGGRDSSALGVLPSNMSQVTRASDMTVGLDAQGKKVKKKRSGFGWLKKAFSLSEEEKREFEEARRRRDFVPAEPNRERVFLDGRRLQR